MLDVEVLMNCKNTEEMRKAGEWREAESRAETWMTPNQ